MAYLDNTGLAYFWGKIKAWANSAFALLGHTHPSSDVTLMTGYSKPSSSSAISASDTLNQAVGKLEKGMELFDGNVVHKTGDETVAGIKVFKNNLILQNDSIPSSGTPSANTAINLMARDIDTTYTHGIFFYRDPTPNSVMYFRVFKPNDSSVYANMQLGYNNDGTTYFIAPSTLASRINGTDVLTRDWIPKDTRIVHTTGNETISGSKIFTNNSVNIAPSSGTAQLVLTADTDNDSIKRRAWLRNDGDCFWILHSDAGNINDWNNTRTYYQFGNKRWIAEDSRLVFVNRDFKSSTGCPDTDGGLYIANWDANMNATHSIIFHRTTAGSTTTYLRVRRPGSNSSTYADLAIKYDENGYSYATCPTTVPSANDTKIATTAWVRTFCDTTQKYMKAVSVTGSGNAVTAASLSNGTLTLTKGSTFLTSHQSLSNYVTLNGVQTITGTKTFTQYLATNNNLGLQATTGSNYILSNFSGIAGNTSNPAANCETGYILRANDGSFVAGTYMLLYTNGDVRHFLRHNHYSSSGSTGLVFYSYDAKAEGYLTVQTDNKYRLGIPDHRWSAVYAATASIQTSDERLKVDVVPVPDEVLDVWEGVEWKQFKFTDSVEEKGLDGARLHAGAVAQSIGRAFAAAGLDASRYGFYCYDSWDAKDAVYDGNGQILDNAQEAGDRYSLRYEEVLCIEAAYQRRRADRAEAHIAALEDRLAALELRLGSE